MTEPKISVFYDGKCGLCRREIAFYRRIAAPERFEWVDLTVDADRLAKLGVSRDAAMRMLHVVDRRGRLQIGVHAFLTIWRGMPAFRPLAWLVGLPGVRNLAEALYQGFAAWRYQRRGLSCDL